METNGRSLLAGAMIVLASVAALLAQEVPVPWAGLPLSTFQTTHFAGSGTCALCHSSLRDTTGQDVSIDAHWRSTMMANASRDPLWQAKMSSEVARQPALKAVIEDKCATCHTPMARTQAIADTTPVALLDDGFLNPVNPLHPAAADGVSCTLCHQIQPSGLGTPGSFTGHYQIDTASVAPHRAVFGPFPAPLINPMQHQSGFTPTEGPHTRDSAICATCHTLYTPTVDASGAVVGQLPEQTPYLEWTHSAYGDGVAEDQSCQQCHMPAAAGSAALSNRPRGGQLPQRAPFAQHQFVGANTFGLELLKSHGGELGVTASAAQLDATIQRTDAQLQTRTARLAIIDPRVEGDELHLAVTVESLAGHKLPTGFPSRRAWLHLLVQDADGRLVFESGRPLADGRIDGNAADLDPAAVEPHYDRITEPGQVQVYEAVMRDTDGRVTYTLLRGAAYLKDNRLLPAGFNPATAHADVGVYGDARYDSDFGGGSDQVRYRIDARAARGPLTVTARLLYQTVSYRFAQDLLGTPTPAVEQFRRFYDAADKLPRVLASAQAVAAR